jgi:hypothetical protein
LRRNRRLVVMDRVVPFLAALVGLVALAGAVVVQATGDARHERLSAELTDLRLAVDLLAQRTDLMASSDTVEGAPDDGTAEALLALQARIDALETELAKRPAVAVASTETTGAFSASADGTAAEIDPSWPTEDCIPLGTRFVASTGDSLAICQTPVVVKVSAITDDNVMVEDTGVISETAFKPIPGTNCRLTVLDADGAGFAELRVSCS